MNEESPNLPSHIAEDQAIRLAKGCAIDQEIPIGEFRLIQHTAAEDYRSEAGIDLGHGTWMVYFDHPHHENEVRELEGRGVIDTPGSSKYLIFQVNDRTGETELFVRL